MEYDNTNTGAAFKPFEEQKFILQGKLNMNGNDLRIALIKTKTKDGREIIEVYTKSGVLFSNNKTSENQPDYSGPVEMQHVVGEMRVAAWKKAKDGSPYLSFQASSDQDKGAASAPAASGLDDDNIPF